MCEIILWEHFRLEGMELGSLVLYREELSKEIVNKQHYNQSTLKEINPEYSLEGLILKLKLQYFGHLLWTAHLLEKILTLGKIESRRRRGQQRMRWLDGKTDPVDMNLGKLWDMVRDREALCAAVYGIAKSDMTWWLKNRNYISHQFHRRAIHHPANNQVRTRRNAQPSTTIWGTVGCVMTFTKKVFKCFL